jgi:malonyl CoA-acyl carrier protein transacylase
LVHIGAIDFLDALKLVDRRGRCYDASPLGKMAAVMPLDTNELNGYLQLFIQKSRLDGIIEITNYNSPTQHVVAGNSHLVDQLVEFLEDDAMAMCFPVDDKIPMHTRVMDPVAGFFLTALEAAPWRSPHSYYRPGVDPSLKITDILDIPHLLQRHVHGPVYFYQALETLISELDDALLIEVGPKNTLYNLIRRYRSKKVAYSDPC